MIDLAIKHKDQLNNEYQKVLVNPDYRFAFCYNYLHFEIEIDKNSWDKEQYVSISNNKIHGFLQASINRSCNYVEELYIWGTIDRNKIIFGKDLYKFLKSLYDRYDKVVFSCIKGNSIEKSYDKLCLAFGGRVVGEFENHVTTNDNIKRNQKYYEVLKLK